MLEEVARSVPESPSPGQATRRVLTALMEFATEQRTHGVSELSRALGMTKSMVHRALATLLEEQYVVRDVTGSRYQLGPRIIELVQNVGPEPELTALCAPALRRMYDITGETTALTVRSGWNAVTIDGIQGRGSIARRVPIGRVLPLHVTAASRAILASLSDAEIDEYVRRPLEVHTEFTPATPDAVWDDVRRTREAGYAIALFDRTPTAYGISFPVLDRDSAPHGSVTVSGPRERLTPERVEAFLPDLRRVVGDLNQRSRLYRAAAERRG